MRRLIQPLTSPLLPLSAFSLQTKQPEDLILDFTPSRTMIQMNSYPLYIILATEFG